MSTFCSLCGVLVDMWRGGDESDRPGPSDTLSWLTEVRAVRTSRFIHKPSITGVGWLNFHGDIIAPREDSDHYADYNLSQDLENYFGRYRLGYSSHTIPDYWCYVVHDACWELLRDRVDPARAVSAGTLARHLFALLYNTPADDEGTFAPGHDYGHAAEFQNTFSHGYFTRVNVSEHSFITGDAREQFQFEDEVLQDAVPSISGAFSVPAVLGNYSESDIFYLLPNEIMMLILAFLQSTDVCRLRLASRYAADASSPRILSQRFWSSRFDADFEMGFVFAGKSCPRPKALVDWRMLYLRAKVALSSDIFPGLRNRRRIWMIFLELTDALSIRIPNEGWVGDSPYSTIQPPMPKGARLGDSVCAEASFDPGDLTDIDVPAKRPLLLSCRFFEMQSLHWPQGIKDSMKLGVSFVYANGRQHICGFRYFYPLSLHRMIAYSRAGYINPRKEHQIPLRRHDSLECLDVVMANTGLVGLRFHMKTPHSSYLYSVGDTEATVPESGIGRLTLSEKRVCVGFALRLDACKVISISLMEKQVTTSIMEGIHDHNGVGSDLNPVELWNPALPEATPLTSWCFPRPSPTQHFDLCLNVDFGGHEGHLLRSITRVNMFMGGFPAVFLGISFNYENGSERVYGRKSYRDSIDNMKGISAVQQSLHIDGPRGEMITKATVSYCHSYDTIQSITITTNMGRSQLFRLYGKDSWGSGEELVEILEPGPGKTLTAFYIKTKSPLGYFQNISARSMVPCSPLTTQGPNRFSNDSHRVTITCKALNSATEMLAYPRGFVFTAADLVHLSVIRVSVSKEGNSPFPVHISGLRLEYSDSKNPVVLGQWIEEYDSLNIPSKDRLVEVTTWHDLTYTHTRKRVKFGQIRKLQLGTAGGISKGFLDPVVHGKVCLNYRENPYEELTGLVWGYNHEWDHVRALYGPKPGSRGNPLIVAPAGHLNPTWLVRERLFMQEILEDGRPNPVVGVEVTYKDIGSEPSGLTLIYKHGEQRTLGTRGRLLQTMKLLEGEKLVRMDIGVNRGNRIDLISFWANTGRKVDFIEKRNPEMHRVVFILDPSTATNEPATSKLRSLREFPEGAGRFVGFWAVPKRRDRTLRFNMFGPVFETARQENNG